MSDRRIRCLSGSTRLLGLFFTILLAIPTTAQTSFAAIVFDNYDPGGAAGASVYRAAGGSSAPILGSSYKRSAAAFTVSGNDFRLTAVTLPVTFAGPPAFNQSLEVRLAADEMGMPGNTLEILDDSSILWPNDSPFLAENTRLESALNPLLINGGTYWIVLEPTRTLISGTTSNYDYNWALNTTGQSVSVLSQSRRGGFPVDPWTDAAIERPLAFRVEGTATAVPEPQSCLIWLVAGVIAVCRSSRSRIRTAVGPSRGVPLDRRNVLVTSG
ncbi:MAG: choice-of-anchor R domain-containing protein [Planctomycetaceae bacterium]